MPLDVGHHVGVLGRRLLALVVHKVLATGCGGVDRAADALLVAVDVLLDRRALLDLGADVGVRDVIPVGRVVHLVGLAVGVGGDGRLALQRPLLVQVLDDVARRHVRLVHHVGAEQQAFVALVRQSGGVAQGAGVRQYPVLRHGGVVLGLLVACAAHGCCRVLGLGVGGEARALHGVHHAVLVAAAAASGLAGAGVDDVVLLVLALTRGVQRVACDALGRKADVRAPLLVVLVVDGVELLALVQRVGRRPDVLGRTQAPQRRVFGGHLFVQGFLEVLVQRVLVDPPDLADVQRGAVL